MATKIRADFRPSLPGRVREGSRAFYRRSSMITARESMAAVIKNYEGIIRQLHSVTPDAVRNALEPVFDKSLEYVPYKSGRLSESAILEVEGGPGNVRGSITYGNSTAWYAALVHEYVWLNHNPPTRAKYLQSALEEEMDSFLTSLAVDYASALGM